MKKWLKRLKKDERGLTLVELLAVVVILAIVAAIAFVLIGNVIDNSKKDAHVANAQQLIASAKLYEASVDEIGNDGVSAGDLQGAELLGKLIDPWKKTPYSALASAEVTKTGEEYTVKLTADNGNCSISHTEEKLIELGRKVCDSSTGG